MNVNFIGGNMCTAAIVYLEDIRKKIKKRKCFFSLLIRLNIKKEASVPAVVCGVVHIVLCINTKNVHEWTAEKAPDQQSTHACFIMGHLHVFH